ncbi:hypothetical protein An03g01440 [Aspergillus niger]|uniref:Uncharacterized protein n=2 Tax=Aspergillus niger TaxID=5061 RepID=A2QG07_ASPNC|nr:hypothetical protein An03g01440 [Aspergillus niger]CAK38117.1 hypothetical protein An03g01440 [Aspergillus niger]
MVRAHKEADLSGSEAAGFEADGFRESENDRMLRAEIAVVGYRSALTILSKLLVVRDGFTLLGDLFQGRRRLKRQLTGSNRQGRMGIKKTEPDGNSSTIGSTMNKCKIYTCKDLADQQFGTGDTRNG